MSIYSHFKELYIGNRPKSIYRFRSPPTPPNSIEQIVDLEKCAPRFAFKPSEHSVVQKLSELINQQSHQELTKYDREYKTLRAKGFKLLSSSSLGKVWEHPELDNWLIKACDTPRKPTWVAPWGGCRCDSANYNNLHRVLLAERMREEIAKNKWDIFIPEKRLYRSPHAQSTETLHEKYYVLSKKVDLLSTAETLKQMERLPVSQQRRIAVQICDLIKKTGFTDSNASNIVALKNKQNPTKLRLAIIDTEPIGLMKDVSDPSPDSFRTFECCVLTGLSKLRESFGSKLSAFKEEIEFAIEELQPGGEARVKKKRKQAIKNERLWFIAKIIASILFPLIPLTLLGVAIDNAYNGKGVLRNYDMQAYPPHPI